MSNPAEWWRGAVIYQIYPRSFRDSNDDGVGDLPGIAGQLDYIAALGVDAIWLSPFVASPMRDYGYDVADYCQVDPLFGTLADFDHLLAGAHARGIKVLIDQVWSHTSDQHAWFLESRATPAASRADWYVWADPKPDGSPPNNWLSVFGGPAWQWEPRRRQYYLHHFLVSQPQLNLHNEQVIEALFEVGRFWLDRGVDGFRLDATDFLLHDPLLRDNPPKPPADGVVPARLFALQHHRHDMLQPETMQLLQRIRGLMDGYPGTATLAELSGEEDALRRAERYTSGNNHLHMAYTLRPLRGGLDRPMLLRLLADIAAGDPKSCIAWSFSNHDVVRAISRWGPARRDPAFARLLMALLLTLRGSACVYQGEELGLPEANVALADMQDPYGIAFYPEYRGRDGSRTPLPWQAAAPFAGFSATKPWLPVDPAHVPLSVDRQEADSTSLLSHWRRFLAWRKTHPALIGGVLENVALPAPLVAYRRRDAAESILIVLNTAAEAARLPPAAIAGARPLDGHGFVADRVDGAIGLPRYGVWFAAEDAGRE